MLTAIMVGVDYEFAMLQNYIENKPLGVIMMPFLDYFNWDGKTHPQYE